MTPLKVAIEGGSVLVVGEPGAGKTGVLVAIAMEMLDRNDPLIFLSADRLAGVATRNDLKDELALEHDLLDVLAAWPGTAPGTLIIDALDASRGGTSERVLSDLIEDGLRKIGHRWSIVASIRTFDLLNGKRLRGIAAGNPPFDAFVEPGLEQVRHFRIPRLSENEVEDVAQRRPELHALFKSAPSSVRDLLLNFFNLALAVELLEDGALGESIQTIETQSDLIDRYDNLRLPSGKLRCAAEDAVEVMVNRHRLYVPRIKVKN
ncbi:MAG: ATP-binding protein, partial [Boseongicola sp. SB0677_bin_26]|nr:ATP-binding protein [Boseongicola sp. SB0677_bin_26]